MLLLLYSKLIKWRRGNIINVWPTEAWFKRAKRQRPWYRVEWFLGEMIGLIPVWLIVPLLGVMQEVAGGEEVSWHGSMLVLFCLLSILGLHMYLLWQAFPFPSHSLPSSWDYTQDDFCCSLYVSLGLPWRLLIEKYGPCKEIRKVPNSGGSQEGRAI